MQAATGKLTGTVRTLLIRRKLSSLATTRRRAAAPASGGRRRLISCWRSRSCREISRRMRKPMGRHNQETLRRARLAGDALADRFDRAWIPEAERAWHAGIAASLTALPALVNAMAEATMSHRAIAVLRGQARAAGRGAGQDRHLTGRAGQGGSGPGSRDLDPFPHPLPRHHDRARRHRRGNAGVLLIRRLVRPMEVLADGATAMARGDLGHRIDLETDDEFGRLAKTINWVTEKRQRSEEALRIAANRDSLTGLLNRVVFPQAAGRGPQHSAPGRSDGGTVDAGPRPFQEREGYARPSRR